MPLRPLNIESFAKPGKPVKGAYTVLGTPFTEDGEMDCEGLRKNVEWQISQGIQGLVANGSTGEFVSLEDGERESGWLQRSSKATAGRVLAK